MAIARGNNSKATGLSGQSTCTWAHTVPSTANALLVVGVEQVGNTLTATATYNGNAMTELQSINMSSGGRKVHLFYIVIANPDGNAHNIVVTLSAAHTSYYWLLTAADYSDAQQGAPHKNSSTTEDYPNSSPISASVTTTDDNCWLISVTGGTKTLSAGTNTSYVIGNDTASPSDSDSLVILDSNGAKTPAGTYSLQATWTGDQAEAMILIAIAPYASITGPAHIASINGVASANILSRNGVALGNIKSINGVE